MGEWFRETPLEQHVWRGIPIGIKREDLCTRSPLPPLSKMRGIHAFMSGQVQAEGFGVLDTRISKSGLGVSVFAQALGVPCRYYFPTVQGEDWLTPTRKAAQDCGAELIPMAGGRIAIVYARAKAQEPGVMLPLGFPVFETVQATRDVFSGVPAEAYAGGTIIVPVGTGTILAGILAGLARKAVQPARVVGVTASMAVKRVSRRIAAHLARTPGDYSKVPAVTLVREGEDYYSPGMTDMPVPGSPYYEGKAWQWLDRHLGRLPQPFLFWNIGA